MKDASASPNPVTLADAQALAKELKALIGEPPAWLTAKVCAPGVHFAAIGGETSLFRLASELIDGTCLSKARLLEAIENLCGKTDLELRLMEDVPAAMKQPELVSLPRPPSLLCPLLPCPFPQCVHAGERACANTILSCISMATPRELRQAKLSFLLTMGIFGAFLAPRASYLQVIPKLVLLYVVLNALGGDEVVTFPHPPPAPPREL